MQATMQIARTGFGARAGEEAQPSLEEIFLGHKDRVFRAAYRVTGNAGDAEDVLQTVFLRLAQQETLAGIDNLAAYLHRSTVNAALDLLRRGKSKDARTLSLDDDDGQRRIEPVSANTVQPALEIRDWLRQALARLNPRSAEMFVLRFIEEYSNREIAGMMNTSSAVVAVMLHRTRAQLKKDFKELARDRR